MTSAPAEKPPTERQRWMAAQCLAAGERMAAGGRVRVDAAWRSCGELLSGGRRFPGAVRSRGRAGGVDAGGAAAGGWTLPNRQAIERALADGRVSIVGALLRLGLALPALAKNAAGRKAAARALRDLDDDKDEREDDEDDEASSTTRPGSPPCRWSRATRSARPSGAGAARGRAKGARQVIGARAVARHRAVSGRRRPRRLRGMVRPPAQAAAQPGEVPDRGRRRRGRVGHPPQPALDQGPVSGLLPPARAGPPVPARGEGRRRARPGHRRDARSSRPLRRRSPRAPSPRCARGSPACSTAASRGWPRSSISPRRSAR